MGVLSTTWRTYSGKIKFVTIIVILLLLVGGFFYIKKLHSDIQRVEADNKRLHIELDQSESEKMLLLKEVAESSDRVARLNATISKNSQTAAEAKRSLEKLRSDYDKLLKSDPSAASKVLVTEYNSYVDQLYCASGGGKCE